MSRPSRFHSSRPSSPYADGDENLFTTATQTSFQNINDLIHSTPQQQHTTDDARAHPPHYDRHPDVDEDNTQGSADMSIEMGRGVKRGAQGQGQDQDEELSSIAIFSFANDNSQSQHDTPDTPPARLRNSQRKADGMLRKEASIRRATESARANDAMKRTSTGGRRAVSDSQAKTGAHAEATHDTATATVVGSRFAQRVSSSYNVPTRYNTASGLASSPSTPRRQTTGNITVQSATHTANQSFMLPNIENITELVFGTRQDGTPLVRRTASTRSRFVSTSHRAESQTQTHLPVHSVGLPEDEKAIFASLQMLYDRVNQLEQEKNEAQKHIEEYEQEVIELRAQVQVAAGRADTGLGSEDESGHVHLPRAQRTRMDAKVKAAEERLERSERKASVSNITVTRITKERDVLLSQLATAYVNNERLEKENEGLRETASDLQGENEELAAREHRLKDENAKLRTHVDSMKTKTTSTQEATRRKVSSSRRSDQTDDIADGIQFGSRNEGIRQTEADGRRDRRERAIDETIVRDLASRTEREIQKLKDAASTGLQESQRVHRNSSARSRSRSQRRMSSTETKDHSNRLRRYASVPVELEQTKSLVADDNSTQQSSRSMRLAEQFEEDLTVLSDLDPSDVARLRQRLEEELQAKHSGKNVNARTQSATDFTAHSMTQRVLSRKPSLKDATKTGTGRRDLGDDPIDDILKVTKSVRVQSPHTLDEISHSEDKSLDMEHTTSQSNISRRRRRTASADAMTSAFIIPDIEFDTRNSLPLDSGSKCVPHKAKQCTACEHDETQVEIPMPVPVTEREEMADVTDATVRPSQPPAQALAMVIKNLEDEIKHLKLKRDSQNRIYNQHDPALSRRKRVAVKAAIDALTTEIERKSDQVYALYDVLEGHKDLSTHNAAGWGKTAAEMTEQDVEDTLQSLGIDPIELSGTNGRKAPVGLDDVSDNESELPFEGFSEMDGEVEGVREVRV